MSPISLLLNALAACHFPPGCLQNIQSGLAAVLFGSARWSLGPAEPEYDLVIRGGRISDGTGNPWFEADVAVRADRIALIGQVRQGTSRREIQAKGLIVAPGFIDMHSHSDWVLLEDGNAQSKIRQGVTTEVIGEGFSAGPWKGKLMPKQVEVRGKTI